MFLAHKCNLLVAAEAAQMVIPVQILIKLKVQRVGGKALLTQQDAIQVRVKHIRGQAAAVLVIQLQETQLVGMAVKA
jgi:hypothetical protein